MMTWDSGGAILLGSFGTVVMVWIGSLVVKHFSNNEDAAEEAHKRITDLTGKITEVAMDLLKHQRYVAETYVPKQAFDRIEAKLDRLIERQGNTHD
ncbi:MULTISPECIES: hypothetical protein [Paraburkholderia]|uniref:hypothetical protein n=1 Tax=Paraburkholderia TaxID=1822464 RepID=UPI00224CC601|nr:MULTISPECIES: hypothetical protein [Paraburkholderia]MCX4155006.1 hypothetical protein [Paraburkholderia aspalathi]MDN7164416.1 hypothetical protein [Paraburkholderia sp. SECH2]MDQ6392901.1 hypothetical protein [Paraburkholderia aspalathi]